MRADTRIHVTCTRNAGTNDSDGVGEIHQPAVLHTSEQWSSSTPQCRDSDVVVSSACDMLVYCDVNSSLT